MYALAHDYEVPRTIGRTQLADGHLISTVSMVMPDTNGYKFETLVWNNDGHEVDGTRYRTEDEARKGHDTYVAYARSGTYDHGWWDDCDCKNCHDSGEIRTTVPCPKCSPV